MRTMVVFGVMIFCMTGIAMSQSAPDINVSTWSSADSHRTTPSPPPSKTDPDPARLGGPIHQGWKNCRENCQQLPDPTRIEDCYRNCSKQWLSQPLPTPTRTGRNLDEIQAESDRIMERIKEIERKSPFNATNRKGCQQCEENCGRMYQTRDEVMHCQAQCNREWYR
jgi:hypothetical protein